MGSWDSKTFTRLTYLSDVNISKDGRLVAYTATRANMEKDRYDTTIVIHSLTEGGRMFIDGASMPRISPDGTKLLSVKPLEEGKKSALMLHDLRSLSGHRLRQYDAIIDISWAPDGRRVLVTTYKRRKDEHLFFEERVPAWFDSRGFIDGENVVLDILDSESGEVIDKVELKFFAIPYFKPALWLGNKIAYTVPKRENPFKFADIYLYDGGSHEKILENVSMVAVHANRKQLLLLGKERKEKMSEHDYLHIWEGGELRPLTQDLIYDNRAGKLDAEGNLYFTLAREGKVTLHRMGGAGDVEPIVSEDAWVSSFDVSDDGTTAFLKETPTSPAELYVWRGGETVKVTDYNGPVMKSLNVRNPKHFRFESLSLKIDGWYIKPDVRDGEKVPVIVFVHGGPKGMYGYYFKYEFQLLSDRGYYIVYVNPRGSDGYEEEFALKVIERVGLEDFQDILNGLEKFFELEPQADRERVGITGISYGGFMTNWALTQSELFKAGVSENGISYWLTSYAFSDIGLWFDREVIGDDPLHNENYRKLSPIFYVDRVKAPVLLIHSLEDYRCPLDQSLMFYHLLRDLGKEAYIAIFKKGPHGHSIRGSPKHRAKRYRLLIEFFERKLKKYEEGFDIDEVLKD